MDREALISGMEAVRQGYGPWHSHNVALPHGVFTIGAEPLGDNYRAVKFLRLVIDTLRKPLTDLRVLDLGCGEGLYALEFAQHGAEALGVEARDQHLARAEFARRALALETARFIKRDVRDLTVEEFGRFDVILCSGILYHLDQPGVFAFIENLRKMCSGVCIIDTSISLSSDVEAVYRDQTYRGSYYQEHSAGLTPDQKMEALGASIDNDESFWITKHDLVNLLMNVGFSSVLECLAPVPYMLRNGRVTLTAMAGAPATAFQQIGAGLSGKRWPPHWGVKTFAEPPASWGAMQHGCV